MNPDDSDQALLAHCAGGEADAFERLYLRYSPGAYAHALRTLGDPVRAEAALREAVLEVFGTAPGAGPRESVGVLLHRAVRRLCMEADWSHPSAGAGGAEPVSGPLEAAWKALPAPFRDALSLRLDAGLSWPLIAEVLGLPEGAARSNVHRALERLMEELPAPDAGAAGGPVMPA